MTTMRTTGMEPMGRLRPGHRGDGTAAGRSTPASGNSVSGKRSEKLPEFEVTDFLDQECRKDGGKSLPSTDQLIREEMRLYQEMGKIVRLGSQKGASGAEMARALTGELKAVCDEGYYEGQVGSRLLSAANTWSHGCAYRRGDEIIVRTPEDPQGHRARSADLLEDAGHAFSAERRRWLDLGSRLQGSFQITDDVPHEGGLIDRLEKGQVTSQQVAREIDRILRKGYSPFGGEAFEGAPSNASLGYLKKVLGEENFNAALHPEGFVDEMTRQLDNIEITMGKDENGKPVSTPEAVRDCLANGDPLPAGVTVKHRPDLKDRVTDLKDRLKSWLSSRWKPSAEQ